MNKNDIRLLTCNNLYLNTIGFKAQSFWGRVQIKINKIQVFEERGKPSQSREESHWCAELTNMSRILLLMYTSKLPSFSPPLKNPDTFEEYENDRVSLISQRPNIINVSIPEYF